MRFEVEAGQMNGFESAVVVSNDGRQVDVVVLDPGEPIARWTVGYSITTNDDAQAAHWRKMVYSELEARHPGFGVISEEGGLARPRPVRPPKACGRCGSRVPGPGPCPVCEDRPYG